MVLPFNIAYLRTYVRKNSDHAITHEQVSRSRSFSNEVRNVALDIDFYVLHTIHRSTFRFCPVNFTSLESWHGKVSVSPSERVAY